MFEKLTTGSKSRRAASLALMLSVSPLPVCAAPASPVALEMVAGSADAGKARLAEQGVDESALRYYAATGQAARAEAETRRLQSLYPNWTPPDNIYDKRGAGDDEEDLWDLYAADRIDELRAAIDRRRASEPGWEPSADLNAKFRAKAFRREITALSKADRFGEIVKYLKSTGARLDGVEIDLLWTIAEAYQKSGLIAPAVSVYTMILTGNNDASQRMATMQKAIGALRIDEVEQLLTLARKDASGQSEFAPIAPDIARARISAFLHDERPGEVAGDDLKLFGEYARKAKDANQPALLAWYYFKLKRYTQALDWFKFSLENGGDAMVAHGLAHSLRFLGLKREAEEVAYAWREPLVNNAILFVDILETDLTKAIPPYIEPERLARYGDVVLATASGQGAQALAWYAYNSCQFDVARQWFERAVAWFPKEPTVYGYALTLRRLKKPREAAELINRYDGLFPKVVELLFPDGKMHPPTPCEMSPEQQQRLVNGYSQPQSYAQTYPYAAGPSPYGQETNRLSAWGRVASPAQAGYGQAGYGGAAGPPMPKINRAEFPLRVEAENPLRFAPMGQGALYNAAVGDAAPAMAGGFSREPVPGAFPLVARRVPGVGPMPYERYGFALLPGYNGVTVASSPTAAEQIAPAGTLWSLERGNELAAQSGAPGPFADTRTMARPMIDPIATSRAEPLRN